MVDVERVRTAIAAACGYAIRDDALLLRACTHASRLTAQTSATVRRQAMNERLEFLGDALLGAALAEWLCERLPDADEGELSRHKSRLASRQVLAEAYDRCGLHAVSLVGATMGPADRLPMSVKANLAEAILAAIHLDGGWNALVLAVRTFLAPAMEHPDVAVADPRTALQHWCLAKHHRLPDYAWARSGGSDHQPLFTASAQIDGRIGEGSGSSRKRAEAAAAQALLDLLRAG